MNKEWQKLETWLASNQPGSLLDLNPPASDSDIQALEETIGISLPADFIATLKIHNGQKGQARGIFSGLEFLSTQRIQSEWMVWKNLLESGDFSDAEALPAPGVQKAWWTPAWIPFTNNGAGDHLCIDMNPASQGLKGQIIAIWHDDGKRSIKADSFAQWFGTFTQSITKNL